MGSSDNDEFIIEDESWKIKKLLSLNLLQKSNVECYGSS